jgi:hypothetical protein
LMGIKSGGGQKARLGVAQDAGLPPQMVLDLSTPERRVDRDGDRTSEQDAKERPDPDRCRDRASAYGPCEGEARRPVRARWQRCGPRSHLPAQTLRHPARWQSSWRQALPAGKNQQGPGKPSVRQPGCTRAN